jgi:bla regulator protein blaR1
MRRWLVIPALLAGAMTTPAQAPAKKLPQFDVVSIKLNRSGEPRGILQISPDGDRVIVVNAPMFRVVQFIFDMQRNDLVVGAPDWMRTERWDIEAKVAPDDLAAFHALTFAQQKRMLEAVLMERCKMAAKVAKKEVPVYALVVAKGGIKMQALKPGEAPVVRDAAGNIVQDWDIVKKYG